MNIDEIKKKFINDFLYNDWSLLALDYTSTNLNNEYRLLKETRTLQQIINRDIVGDSLLFTEVFGAPYEETSVNYYVGVYVYVVVKNNIPHFFFYDIHEMKDASSSTYITLDNNIRRFIGTGSDIDLDMMEQALTYMRL